MKYTWFDYDDLYNHISITWVFTLEFRVERFEQLTLKLQEDSRWIKLLNRQYKIRNNIRTLLRNTYNWKTSFFGTRDLNLEHLKAFKNKLIAIVENFCKKKWFFLAQENSKH